MLHKPCAVDGRGLLADVGANFGWFSVFAATLGCRVVAWEPVPRFRAFLEYSLARNGVTDRVEVRAAVAAEFASAPGERNFTVVAPQRGIWGTAGVDGANIDTVIDNEGRYERVEVRGERLDAVLNGTHVDLLKLDVEGYEPDALAGAKGLFEARAVDNLVMEYSPHVAERARRFGDLSRAPQALLDLMTGPSRFTVGHIESRGGDAEFSGWSQALGLLAQVTPANLKHDLADAKLVTKAGAIWAREPCAAMVNLALVVDGMPERFHPKSFRSVISFNTNVWASRLPRFVPYLRGPPVGVLPAEQSVRDSWFPRRNNSASGADYGSGGRLCHQLRRSAKQDRLDEPARASLLVSHHCRCDAELPCKAAEAIADDCARRGEIPFED